MPQKRDLEDIFDYIGSCGRFQVLLIIVVNMAVIMASWGMVIMALVGANAEWSCPGYNITNQTLYGGYGNTSEEFQFCPTEGGACPNVTFSDEGRTITEEWQLICDKKWAAGIVTTLQMVGVTSGVFLTGQLADIIGRKKTFFLVYAFLLLTNFLSAFSSSVEMYTVFRLLVGMGSGGVIVCHTVIPLEYLGKKHRTFSNLPPFFAVGIMLLAGLAYKIHHWRTLTMVLSGLGLPYLLCWWFVPESTRWLMAKGRYQEAEDILRRIAKFNKMNPPQLTELKLLERTVDEPEERRYSVVDLFRSKEYARKTLLLLTSWFACGTVYYGLLFGVKNLVGDRYVNLVLNAAMEIPSNVALLINNRIGRRYTIILFLTIVVTCSFVVAILDWTGVHNPEVVSAMSLVAKLSLTGAWQSLMVFTPELYPTVVRNIGVGTCQSGARIGSMLAPLLIELHVIAPWIPYVAFGSIALVSVATIAALPETTDQHIPDYLPSRKKQHVASEEVDFTNSKQ